MAPQVETINMNRTLILVLLVVALGAGAFFISRMSNAGPSTSLVGADREFAVPREQIYKIFLADRNGNKSTLTRAEGRWVYNDQYTVRPDAINNLLSAIEQIRMKFKPTDAAVPYMVQSLATDGIKVEIYGKNEELIKAYYVGGATNDERGTYVILDGAEQPYVTELGSWEGNIRFRYNLTGDDWRDRTVFGTTVENIAEITVEYPKQQDKSFRINLRDGKEEVTPFYALSPARQVAPKPGKVEAYAACFEKILAASFDNEFRDRDSIAKQLPFAIISLTDKAGQTASAKLFPIYPEAVLDVKTWTTTQPEGVTAYYALTQNNDFIILQNEVIGKLLWAYSFFYD